ncbi:MAG: hypothetical protein QNJ09_09395 [Paracoccaceae bacterium]|nr:hypothetical protein [Paracoccaceae bacterium]
MKHCFAQSMLQLAQNKQRKQCRRQPRGPNRPRCCRSIRTDERYPARQRAGKEQAAKDLKRQVRENHRDKNGAQQNKGDPRQQRSFAFRVLADTGALPAHNRGEGGDESIFADRADDHAHKRTQGEMLRADKNRPFDGMDASDEARGATSWTKG